MNKDQLQTQVLTHLRELVRFDTRNPPRQIGTDGIFAYLSQQLSGFTVELRDHGAGSVSLLAVRGRPSTVFNVHLDTVPSSDAWTASPFELRIDNDKAIGLGACDIKGAAAVLLSLAQHTDGDMALLFTSDEEANDARAVAAFLQTHGARFKTAIVAEPTQCQAVLAHRGISSVLLRFEAKSGHASSVDALQQSAVHQAMRWGVQALEFVEAKSHQRFGGLQGLRMNIGRVEGGIKANMIAPSSEVRFGFRPLPSQDMDELHKTFSGFASQAAYQETFRGPCLPSGDTSAAEQRRLQARDLADALNMPIGNAVDFWTEASLFSAAGMTALVFGPGDIAQAHSADEWVSIAQLMRYAECLKPVFEKRHE